VADTVGSILESGGEELGNVVISAADLHGEIWRTARITRQPAGIETNGEWGIDH
jgi:hypothetical protein